MDLINKLKLICDNKDYAFRIKYEKCFYEFYCEVRKVNRTLDKPLEGGLGEIQACARGGDLDNVISDILDLLK